MPQTSAGILLYRYRDDGLQVLLAHPGGPFWAHKSEGVWTVPKGLLNEGESLLDAAKREFAEELGIPPPDGDYRQLPPVKAKSAKTVFVFAAEGDLDVTAIVSNTFRAEYPYKSGNWQSFPEVNRAQWFGLKEARKHILTYQAPLLPALTSALKH